VAPAARRLRREASVADGLLAFAAAYLATTFLITGGAHVRRPRRLLQHLAEHHVLPRATHAPAAFGVVAAELAVALTTLTALAGLAGHRRIVAFCALAAALGVAFLAYLSRLRAVSPQAGNCGCSPLEAPLTPLTMLPAAMVVLVALVGLSAALGSGGGPSSGRAAVGLLLAGWGTVNAVLVILLPASVGTLAAEGIP
jgi:hypothetical protein